MPIPLQDTHGAVPFAGKPPLDLLGEEQPRLVAVPRRRTEQRIAGRRFAPLWKDQTFEKKIGAVALLRGRDCRATPLEFGNLVLCKSHGSSLLTRSRHHVGGSRRPPLP